MKTLIWLRAIAFGLATAASGAAVAQPVAVATTAPLPPASAFYSRPAVEQSVLSPSGRWLAILVPVGKLRNALAVVDVDDLQMIKIVANFTDFDVEHVSWVSDDTLVFSVDDRNVAQGETYDWPGLFSIGRDGEGLRQLVQLRRHFVTGGQRPGVQPLSANHVLLQVPNDGGNAVIVGEIQWDNGRDLAAIVAKRLDVKTGRSTAVAERVPPNVQRWLFDGHGMPRAVVNRQDGGRFAVQWHDKTSDTWKVLNTFTYLDEAWSPVAVDAGGDFFVTSNSGPAGEAVLKRFDFTTGKPEPEPLVSTPGFDFQGSLLSESPGGVKLGVRTTTDAETTVWFDPVLKAAQADIDRRLPGRINRLSCRACGSDHMTVLVSSWSDRDPGDVWLWRASGPNPAEATWRKVGALRPAIDPRRMATLDLHRIKARDGQDLPVWVTTPAGAVKGQPLPTVVLVHGGPWVRGVSWRWAADAQFLASRGYLVIEPEFRGSTGYGFRHLQAGFKQWGQAMQDDVADATRWAAQAAGADPKRICIAGASYGGYSTLMGLVRDPDLYRCGIAWVAVTEPRLMYEWSSRSDLNETWRRYGLPALLGDPKTDAAMLEQASPLAQAARIKAPLMLVFGESDRRVPLEHGTRLRKALQDAGRDPTWVTYPQEGHGWLLQSTRIDFANRVQNFLAEHLK
ncbi:MAG: prolyl oligopeptidase family serine peptidase [Rubrivivax sp.]